MERGATALHLFTALGMVAAGLGVSIIPSYWRSEIAGRAVAASQLTNPVVRLDFQRIEKAGRKLSAAGQEFVSFLEDYMVDWAERTGATQ